MFRRAAGLLDFEPQDGMRRDARPSAVYEPRGELQFVAEAMRRAGAGSLYEQFLRLLSGSRRRGLFARAQAGRCRFPTRIGIVTSLGAAALHDVATALARRAPRSASVVWPSLLCRAARRRALVSALLANAANGAGGPAAAGARGGSLEDLWAFNDERVVRAVGARPCPSSVAWATRPTFTWPTWRRPARPTPTAPPSWPRPPAPIAWSA